MMQAFIHGQRRIAKVNTIPFEGPGHLFISGVEEGSRALVPDESRGPTWKRTSTATSKCVARRSNQIGSSWGVVGKDRERKHSECRDGLRKRVVNVRAPPHITTHHVLTPDRVMLLAPCASGSNLHPPLPGRTTNESSDPQNQGRSMAHKSMRKSRKEADPSWPGRRSVGSLSITHVYLSGRCHFLARLPVRQFSRCMK
jgi:hypothetical protein